MPKVKKSSQLRREARRIVTSEPLSVPVKDQKGPQEDQQPSDEANASSTQELSRGQRKRQAKREKFLKRERMIMSSLKLKKEDEQKNRIDGLDAIREALVGAAGPPQQQEQKEQPSSEMNDETEQPHRVRTNKGKMHLAAKEMNHFNLVSQHPAFKADPFGALQEHLKNTLSKQAEQLQRQTAEKNREDAKKAKERKQLKKEQLIDYKLKRHKFKRGIKR